MLVFTTDFGLSDPYAGVMRGVALAINPAARCVDLTHQIAPQNIAQGCFVLGVSFRYFPADAIHIAVVDPGVGTARRPLLLDTPHGRFVGPDNGLFSDVLAGFMEGGGTGDSGLAGWPIGGALAPGPGESGLPPGVAAWQLTNPAYWRHPVSRTFHGRDIFAPAAAHLSLGAAPADMGEPVDRVVWRPTPRPEIRPAGLIVWLRLRLRPEIRPGVIAGQVVYQDGYGNLITNIPAAWLPEGRAVQVEIAGRVIAGLSRTFGDAAPGQSVVALVGSLGFLEVAAPNASAAARLKAGPGTAVSVQFPGS